MWQNRIFIHIYHSKLIIQNSNSGNHTEIFSWSDGRAAQTIRSSIRPLHWLEFKNQRYLPQGHWEFIWASRAPFIRHCQSHPIPPRNQHHGLGYRRRFSRHSFSNPVSRGKIPPRRQYRQKSTCSNRSGKCHRTEKCDFPPCPCRRGETNVRLCCQPCRNAFGGFD